MSLYNSLFHQVFENNKDRIAINCDNIELTYSQLSHKIESISHKMSGFGIKENSKVVLLIKNPLDFSLTLLSLLRLNAIPMPLYHNTALNKLNHMLETFDVNFVIKSSENERLTFDYQSVNFEDILPVTVYYRSDKIDEILDSISMILFTSGTTSTPKAIMLTEHNIVSNVKAISAYLYLNKDDKVLLIKDLSHSSSIIGELFVGLYNGCSVVMTSQIPITAVILKLMVKKEISVFFAVPTLLKNIMTSPKLPQFDLSKIRIINFYGASMNYKDIEKLIELFPNTNVLYSYGQTEASPRVTYITKSDILKHAGSCGKPIENVKVEVINKDGQLAKPLEKGEVVVTGPNVCFGYYKNEEKTKQNIRNGKLYTGDIGYFDQDGFLYISGRMDNLIISAGKNIYPEEIEGVLISYESIVEALVIPEIKQNETFDLVAYIVLKNGATFSYNKIIEYCLEKLENYKIPKKIIQVDSLEKTASGKIKRIEPKQVL